MMSHFKTYSLCRLSLERRGLSLVCSARIGDALSSGAKETVRASCSVRLPLLPPLGFTLSLVTKYNPLDA